MADFTLKSYMPDGSTLKTAYYPGGVVDDFGGFKFTLNRFGGFAAGAFSVAEHKDTPYKFDKGDVVKAFWTDGSLFYTATVEQCSKNLANKSQNYILSTKWDLLDQIDLASDSFGSAGNQSSITTVYGILSYLHTTYVAPLNAGINWNSSKVSCAVSVEDIKLKSTGNLKDFLNTLLILAGSDGNVYSTGIDEAGDFYFLPTPSSTICNVDVADNCDSAIEQLAYTTQIANAVVIQGSVMPENGYVYTKKYIAANAGTYKKTALWPVKVSAISKSSDAAKFAAGLFTKYSVPTVTIQDLEFRPRTGENPYLPKPWLGKISYVDSARSISITECINSIDITFGTAVSYKAQVGLGTISQFDSVFGAGSDYLAAQVGDKYHPAVLDQAYSEGDKQDIFSQPEATEDGLVNPTADGGAPHMDGPLVPTNGVCPADVYPVSLFVCGGMKISINEPNPFMAVVHNGSALDPDSQPVKFKYYLCSDEAGATVIDSGNLTGGRLSTLPDGSEIWNVPNSSMSFGSAGVLFVAVSVCPDNAKPTELKWFPADLSNAQNITKGISARVVDPSQTGSGGGTNTVYVLYGRS